jgi:hypothetical protein
VKFDRIELIIGENGEKLAGFQLGPCTSIEKPQLLPGPRSQGTAGIAGGSLFT